MEEPKKYLLVFSNPVAGREDEYNDWYDNRHLADIVAVDGVRWAQRFEVVESPLAGRGAHRYLAVYECDGDLAEIAAQFGARREDGRMLVTDSIDTATTTVSVWVPRGPQVDSPE